MSFLSKSNIAKNSKISKCGISNVTFVYTLYWIWHRRYTLYIEFGIGGWSQRYCMTLLTFYKFSCWYSLHFLQVCTSSNKSNLSNGSFISFVISFSMIFVGIALVEDLTWLPDIVVRYFPLHAYFVTLIIGITNDQNLEKNDVFFKFLMFLNAL